MVKSLPSLGEVRDDTPLRLDIAAKLAFPDGSIGISSLRREAARGRLQVWRVAGKDMTTLAEIKNMVDRCLVKPSLPVSGSDQPLTTAKRPGSSLTEESNTALAAARMRVQKLKNSSSGTSPGNTTPSPSAPVIPLRSR